MFKSSIPPAARRLAAAVLAGALMGLAGTPALAEDPPVLQPGAPDRYTVRQGDTLWGISGKYLNEPWRWPQLWRMNQAEVANPHLIYPGQVLLLDRATGTLSVQGAGQAPGMAGAAGAGGVTVLHPRVRTEGLGGNAIPSIPANVIEPFLARPLVIGDNDFERGPSVIATQDGHSTAGGGDRIYASGLADAAPGSDWQIYRRGRPLVDPETHKPITTEAVYVGTARITRVGDPATLTVRSASMEVSPQDHLMPLPPTQLMNYVPHAPQLPVNARVIGLYGGRGEQSYLGSGLDENRTDVLEFDDRREAGPLQVVSFNRGAADGLELGHVLALFRTQVVQHDRSTGPYYNGQPRPADITLPEERYGLAFIFRTFDHVSYGLIVQAQRTVVTGDAARNP
jgi:LysM domain